MNTNKFIVGGIIGGVAYFLLGWVVGGMLLMDFMSSHTTEAGKAVMRGEADMVWWALIVANLLMGFLVSYILSKAGVKSAGGGAMVGLVVGLLLAGSFDLMMYAQTDMGDTTMIAVDVLASALVSAVVASVIGWYLGKGK